MEEYYKLTPTQVAVLRSLSEGIVEVSETEVAVGARLLPDQARIALGALERLGLVNSWVPVTGRTGDHLYVLTGEGQAVSRALAQYRGTPAVGTVVRMPRPTFSGWLSGHQPQSTVEVVSDG
jgi:hypothetical protein